MTNLARRSAEFRRKLYKRLPKWIVANDFEFLASVLCLGAGVPLLLGKIQPKTVDALLPKPIVFAWGLTLTLGSLLILACILHEILHKVPQIPGWLRFKALGLSCLGYACYLYALCIGVTSFRTSGVTVALTLAFGFVCHLRDMQIHADLETLRDHLGLRNY
jgi:hypothetical protein